MNGFTSQYSHVQNVKPTNANKNELMFIHLNLVLDSEQPQKQKIEGAVEYIQNERKKIKITAINRFEYMLTSLSRFSIIKLEEKKTIFNLTKQTNIQNQMSKHSFRQRIVLLTDSTSM